MEGYIVCFYFLISFFFCPVNGFPPTKRPTGIKCCMMASHSFPGVFRILGAISPGSSEWWASKMLSVGNPFDCQDVNEVQSSALSAAYVCLGVGKGV